MTVSAAVRQRVRTQAFNRCGYCHVPQELVWGTLEIEHLLPPALGGTDDEENLWIACRACNRNKSDLVLAVDPLTGEECRLFNPRLDSWNDHFCWDNSGSRVLGITPCGRATAALLLMNLRANVSLRAFWVAAGVFPPVGDARR